jgi:hypothetical protein
MVDFGISSVEPLGPAITVLVWSTASRIGVRNFYTALRSDIKKYVAKKIEPYHLSYSSLTTGHVTLKIKYCHVFLSLFL